MNFLGHSFLCQDYPHLIAGNLAGDSYKGNLTKIKHLPKPIQDGVKLHRFIDDFTDQSEKIKEVAHVFQENGISKVTYIACDILLDHYLSKHWNHYSTQLYSDFIKTIYAETERNLDFLEADFLFLFSKMKEFDWFNKYPVEKGIELILWQFSKRLNFQNDLAKCMNVYLKEIDTIEPLFKSFLKDIKSASNNFILENELNIL